MHQNLENACINGKCKCISRLTCLKVSNTTMHWNVNIVSHYDAFMLIERNTLNPNLILRNKFNGSIYSWDTLKIPFLKQLLWASQSQPHVSYQSNQTKLSTWLSTWLIPGRAQTKNINPSQKAPGNLDSFLLWFLRVLISRIHRMRK